eukprot:gb/GECG01007385.1/.p1 GENE.gb/GECG01007385.1/~~gb/GECG01007385.1/.p1  ORF type:complete len:601 (+),score=76.15 gb/GECG01007385.1/:1-1803(+)
MTTVYSPPNMSAASSGRDGRPPLCTDGTEATETTSSPSSVSSSSAATMASSPTSGSGGRRLSSFFNDHKDQLSKGKRHGKRIVEQSLGSDGILLWNAIERCVLDFYGAGKMHELREAVFELALKGSKVASPSLLKAAKWKQIKRYGERVQKPFMDVLYLAHSCACAGNSHSASVDSTPLTESVRSLHDVLLAILRGCVKEDPQEPTYSLYLTNSFINIGNGFFLDTVMNSERYQEERKMIAGATSALLQKLGHPEFAGADTFRAPRCTKPGCRLVATYDKMCASHALAKVRQRFRAPKLAEFLRDTHMLNSFYQYAHRENNIELKLQLSFVLAVEDYRQIRNSKLKLRRAKIILEKYLSPKSGFYIGNSISAYGNGEINAVAAAIEACETGYANPKHVLYLHRTMQSDNESSFGMITREFEHLNIRSRVDSDSDYSESKDCIDMTEEGTGPSSARENAVSSYYRHSSFDVFRKVPRYSSSSISNERESKSDRDLYRNGSWSPRVQPSLLDPSCALPSTLFDAIKESALESIEVVFQCKFVISKEFQALLEQTCKEAITPPGPGSKGIQQVAEVDADRLFDDCDPENDTEQTGRDGGISRA